jgi:hypothetical protein
MQKWHRMFLRAIAAKGIRSDSSDRRELKGADRLHILERRTFRSLRPRISGKPSENSRVDPIFI